jgi:hypothetical protein
LLITVHGNDDVIDSCGHGSSSYSRTGCAIGFKSEL